MSKHKHRKVDLVFNCEWSDCSKQDGDEDKFYEHVSRHIPELKVVPSGSDGETYECSWKDCGHNTDCPREIVRHVKFHGYHAILKGKGVAESIKRNLPSCKYGETENNALQPWNKPLLCQWEDCTVQHELSGFKEFLAHVQIHTNEVIYGCEPYNCGWFECKFSTNKVKARLVDHVKVHTGERMIACPVCGNMFANVTKFSDHCERQITFNENWKIKCDYCSSYLPNERILRDHMRQHIHHHKCCFCDLTCHSPAVLVEHIRYRHLPYRPYKCSSCPRECKSAYDLKQHLKTHTKDVVKYKCSDCEFESYRQSNLMKHYKDEHGNETSQYTGTFKCHLCDKKYSRGTGLTKHLRKDHKIEKPPGYSRFVYKLEEGGSYQLRQIRLECLEVMETDAESKVSGNENPCDSNKVLAIIDTLNEKGEIIETTYPVSNFECPTELPPDAKVVAVFDDQQRTIDD
uniref:Histone H4 transcription factor n=1 Tax=Lygus hesperus TaxID=30085 RepID=A0A0A9ZCP2_LYGHE